MAGRLRRFGAVLFGQGRPFWVLVGGLLLAYGLPLLFTSDPEDLNRFAGTILQFCGLVLVAKGIEDTRQLFGKPSLRQQLKTWAMALVNSLKAPQPINITLPTITGGATVSGGLVSVKISQGLDARVAELERRLDEMQKTVDELKHGLQKEAAERREEIAREIAGVRAEIERHRRTMENYAAGGLSFEVAGLVWLLVGTAVGSLPGELAFIAKWVLAAKAWIGSWLVFWLPAPSPRWR
jgi:hypothetical protein